MFLSKNHISLPPMGYSPPASYSLRLPWRAARLWVHVAHAMVQSLQSVSLRRRHFLGAACIWVLALHFSHLMAKSDDGPTVWTSPVEPPGAVIVTSLNSIRAGTQDRALGPAPVQNAISDSSTPLVSEQLGAQEAWPSGLRDALDQWSLAWRQQEVAQYLGMYADDFTPAGNMSRQAWAQSRSTRILGKKNIRHEISDLTLQMGKTTVMVKFTQIYQDERIKAVDQKTMQWTQRDGRWWIVSEKTN